jgi:hypothetical protein
MGCDSLSKLVMIGKTMLLCEPYKFFNLPTLDISSQSKTLEGAHTDYRGLKSTSGQRTRTPKHAWFPRLWGESYAEDMTETPKQFPLT